MADINQLILEQLGAIRQGMNDLKQEVKAEIGGLRAEFKELNGRSRQNREDIVRLQATTLRLDVIKISAIIGGVVLVLGVLMWIAGVF